MKTSPIRTALPVLATTIAVALPAAAQEGGTLRVGISQMAPSPDPVVTTFGINWNTSQIVCEGLFAIDASWSPQPMLADSFAYSEDGKTLTITLRQNIPFHGGGTLTAQDAAASLSRFREAAGIGAAFKGVTDSIEVVDDMTVAIHLNTVTPIVPGLLAGAQAAIMSASSIGDASATTPLTGLDCTGPYQLADYRPDQGVTMTRFDGYVSRDEEPSSQAGGKSRILAEIDYLLMPEASVRRDNLLTGAIDVATELPIDFYQQLKDDPGTEPVIVENNQSLTAVFNTKEGPASDVNLRRAIFYALDKEPVMLASVGSPDFYTLDPSWIPDPNSFWYTTAGVPDDWAKPNIEKAKEYLAESNYDGTPLRWLVASEQYEKHYLTAITAAQQLEEIGINVEIQENPMANYIQLRADATKMDVFSSFLPTYVDPTSIAYLNPTYPGFWTDSEKMELMAQLASEQDPDTRKAIFEKVHALAYDQFPFIKYGTEAALNAIRTGVTGAPTSPNPGPTYYNYNVPQ